MTYLNNIPKATDDPTISQGQLLDNFSALNTSNSVNHVAYNNPNQGKHKFLQMPEQTIVPSTAVNEGAVYTKEVPTLLKTGLYWRDEDSGGSGGTERQLTNLYITDLVNSGTAGGSLYKLVSPLGFVIYGGRTATLPTDGAGYTVKLANPGPALSTLITATATIDDGNTGNIPTGVGVLATTNGMTIYVTKAFIINWIIIGIPV